MALEQTLSIIKPDAVSKGHVEEICQRLENSGLSIIKKQSLQLDREKAEGFYIEHKGKPFFEDLIDFMTSGPIQVQVLEGENAIARNREIMGATNPADAAPGTIRADFAESVEANAVHGSDGPDTAREEIAFFFDDADLCPRAD